MAETVQAANHRLPTDAVQSPSGDESGQNPTGATSWNRPVPVENINTASLGQVSELMLLDNQCSVLVHKRSLQNLPLHKAQQVFSKHMKTIGQRNLNPYFRDDSVDIFFLIKNDIFIVAAHPSPETDQPIATVIRMDFLQRVYEILKDCIGTVNEAYVSVNRMLVFELFDEIMTFGYGFASSYAEIKPHLTFNPIRPRIPQQDELASRFFGINSADKSRAQASSIKPKEKIPNSAYLNIVEGLSAVLGQNGEVRSCELWGKLTLISTLERPSPISIQLNEDLVIKSTSGARTQVAGATHIENPSYHACVDSSHLERQRVLRVLPPPDQTRLMVYTLSDPACIRIPILLIPTMTAIEGSRDQNLRLLLINQAESRAVASYVRVKVKLPSWIQSISTTKSGPEHTSSFNTDDKTADWEVKRFHGGQEESILFR
ncbi:Ap-1 complex subunit mu, partial [Plakobranchus ocellatus]